MVNTDADGTHLCSFKIHVFLNKLFKKQSCANVLQRRCLIRGSSLKLCNFIKMGFHYRCFLVNIAKFLTTTFLHTPTAASATLKNS